MKLIRYILHRATWEKLPMLPRQYSAEFELKQLDHDTELLMSMTQARSPHNIKLLMKKHKAKSARELMAILPSRKRPRRLGAKVLGLVRRVMGLTPYDPMKEIARQHRPRQKRQRL